MSIKARYKIFSFNVLMPPKLYEGLIESIITDICCLFKKADTVMKFGIDSIIDKHFVSIFLSEHWWAQAYTS